MKIISHFQPPDAFDDFWNHDRHADKFLQRDLVRVHLYSGGLSICDLTDAMRVGKTCTQFRIGWWPHDHSPQWLFQLLDRHAYDFRAFFNELLQLPWQPNPRWPGTWHSLDRPKEKEGHTSDIVRETRRANRIFSPFGKLNPLTEIPAKWTVPHVLRCLFNGQFEDFKCNGVYTDDYAFDAEVNFQRGDLSAPECARAFVQRVYESPNGWWTAPYEGHVNMCCYHFDSNSFTPKLDMRFNPVTHLDPNSPPPPPATSPAPAKSSKRKTKTPDSPLAGKVRAISPKILHAMIGDRTVLTAEELHGRFAEFCQARTDADWRIAWTAFTLTLALRPVETPAAAIPPAENSAAFKDPGEAPFETGTQNSSSADSTIVEISFAPAPEFTAEFQPPTPPAAAPADRWRQRLAARRQ